MIDFSIVIPAYNLENCIEETLESICKNSLDNVEIIVVNDGSTDNSLQKILEFAKNDGRVKVFDKENGK